MEKQDYEEKLSNIEQVCRFYECGKEIYESFLSFLKDYKDIGLIVSPANLGDTIFISTLAKEYKRINKLKTLIIIAKTRQAEAAKLFDGVDDSIGLGDYEMICLRYYFTISRKFNENNICYGHIPCDIQWQMPGYFFHIPPGFEGIPLIDVWKERVLNLPNNSELGEIIISDEDIPFENEEKFSNAVLIAPAAFTNKGIPELFWEKLTAELNKKGYDVYCNSGGLSYDTVIKGSMELVLSTKELVYNSLFFKHIIAVRSGFTDLVSKTNAPLSVIHLGGTFDRPLRVEYGSRFDDVRDLGRMEDIFPFEYCEGRTDELIQLVLEDIR